MCLAGASELYSDCLGVVKSLADARPQSGFFKRQYAGHIIQAQSDERRRHFKDLINIKAHQSLQEEGISELELFNRTGNHLADLGAKAAAALHPDPDDELHERVKVQVEFLNSFCVLCMKLLGHFPALKEHGEVAYTPQHSSQRKARTKCDFQWIAQGWICTVC